MDYFNRDNSKLMAEDCQLTEIAEFFGTPTYVYSKATIERHWHAFDQAAKDVPHLICYAVKANSNLAVLNVLAKLGSGFDIVSKGELARVLKAGGDANKVVFSGVGKSADEIAYALDKKIYCFNVESPAELDRINEIALVKQCKAPISLRVNPDVDAGTHPYISTGLKENKFGINIEDAEALYCYAATLPGLEIKGIDCHIGSQLTALAPFVDAIDRVLLLVDKLKIAGIKLSHIDVGGGLGVTYDGETPPNPAAYADVIVKKLQPYNVTVVFEPGRAIMANAGVLLTKIEYLKHNHDRNFAIVDAAMNDLLRPALYQAWQAVVPVVENNEAPAKEYDIVGPICETGDFLAKGRTLAINSGDLLAIRSSGAYGFTMSSNYNSRPRVAEVMVDGKNMFQVRARETIEQLWQGECILPMNE